MADNRLDALLYATYDHAPGVILKTTPGTNRVLAATLGWPAIAMPGGFFADGLPLGIEMLARPYDEGLLPAKRRMTMNKQPTTATSPRPFRHCRENRNDDSRRESDHGQTSEEN